MRRWACSQSTGDVLEVAIGTGLTLPFYRAGVRLTGIDVSPAMVEIAAGARPSLGMEVELLMDDAQALGFGDERFDTMVCSAASLTTAEPWLR